MRPAHFRTQRVDVLYPPYKRDVIILILKWNPPLDARFKVSYHIYVLYGYPNVAGYDYEIEIDHFKTYLDVTYLGERYVWYTVRTKDTRFYNFLLT